MAGGATMTSETRLCAGVMFCCDECGEVREPGGCVRLGRGSEPREWAEEWEDAKREGWRARRGVNGGPGYGANMARNAMARPV